MLLLRHAVTAWNTAGIKFGHTDVPLSPQGRADALTFTIPTGYDTIYTSPLSRAYETAAIIANRLGCPAPTGLPYLIERDHGEGEGIPVSERFTRWPDAAIPGRETDEQIRARTLRLLSLAPKRSLVVTHAGVILALTGQKIDHLETVEWTP